MSDINMTIPNIYDINNVMIFGDYSLLFVSVVVTTYLMLAGGTLKGVYGGLFLNLLFLALAYFLNTNYGLTQDYKSMIFFEIILVMIWIMTVHKTT